MTPALQELLRVEPYSLAHTDKMGPFMSALRNQVIWHYEHNTEMKALCDGESFDVYSSFSIEDLPYIPVRLFKTFQLQSIDNTEIIRTLFSSGTSGNPSKVVIDAETARGQVLALTKIMKSFLGAQRRHFFVLDTESTLSSSAGELSSRGTALRGLLSFAQSQTFLLNNDLELNIEEIKKALKKTPKDEPVCFFGFTWLIYNTSIKYAQELKQLFEERFADSVVLHIGGWKKLQDTAVSKKQFNTEISQMLGTQSGKVIDFYGMTEQLGTVYPDCEFGHKHVPTYSEILIRDIQTLQPLDNGEMGFIQLCSPIPHSYPGVNIISDDLGRMIGTDDCQCGRKGKYFIFEKRSEKAEVKGCGDTLEVV